MDKDTEFRTVACGGCAEITEKRSRFIATVGAVHSEDEARQFLAQVKKPYWNARHNCYAFVAGEEGFKKCSDDGEPSGTAGRPILEVLEGENLHDTMIVVSRYFGGTLLGTGGLIRAYTEAAKAGLAASKIVTVRPGIWLTITTDYTGLGKIQYILRQHEIPMEEPVYTEKVQMNIELPLEEETQIEAEITEATGGKAEIIRQGECWYTV